MEEKAMTITQFTFNRAKELENIDSDNNRNILLTWLHEQRIDEDKKIAYFELKKRELIQLKEKLDKVNEHNCDLVLPNEFNTYTDEELYGELYWREIKQLKHWVEHTLANFNFDTDKLYIQHFHY